MNPRETPEQTDAVSLGTSSDIKTPRHIKDALKKTTVLAPFRALLSLSGLLLDPKTNCPISDTRNKVTCQRMSTPAFGDILYPQQASSNSASPRHGDIAVTPQKFCKTPCQRLVIFL